MSRLRFEGEEENPFLFAVLGAISGEIGDGDGDGNGNGNGNGNDDFVLWAILGLVRLRAMVRGAIPTVEVVTEAPAREVVEDVLR